VPKLPRTIRVGPNEGDTKMGGGRGHPGVNLVYLCRFRGFIKFLDLFPGVYPILGPDSGGLSDFWTKFRGFI